MSDAAPKVLRGPLEGADCQSCPFAKDGKAINPVRGIGPENPTWIAIAEGPGNQEVKTGIPLIGPTGQLFNKALQETGTKSDAIWRGNATLCLPTKPDEKLKQQAATACRGRLERELAMFPGRPVLALAQA